MLDNLLLGTEQSTAAENKKKKQMGVSQNLLSICDG